MKRLSLSTKEKTILFNDIYKEYHLKVLSWVNYKIKDKEIAKEITNDIFLKVYKNLELYDKDKSEIQTWIFNITKNTMIDHYRKKELEIVSIEPYWSNNSDKNINGDEVTSYLKSGIILLTNRNQQDDIINKELAIRIKEAITALPKSCERIARMFFIKQCTHEEISIKLNIPIGTVKGNIFRAKKILQKILI